MHLFLPKYYSYRREKYRLLYSFCLLFLCACVLFCLFHIFSQPSSADSPRDSFKLLGTFVLSVVVVACLVLSLLYGDRVGLVISGRELSYRLWLFRIPLDPAKIAAIKVLPSYYYNSKYSPINPFAGKELLGVDGKPLYTMFLLRKYPDGWIQDKLENCYGSDVYFSRGCFFSFVSFPFIMHSCVYDRSAIELIRRLNPDVEIWDLPEIVSVGEA